MGETPRGKCEREGRNEDCQGHKTVASLPTVNGGRERERRTHLAERRDYLQKLVPLGKILSLIWPLDYPRAKLPSDNPPYIKGNRKAVVGGNIFGMVMVIQACREEDP